MVFRTNIVLILSLIEMLGLATGRYLLVEIDQDNTQSFMAIDLETVLIECISDEYKECPAGGLVKQVLLKQKFGRNDCTNGLTFGSRNEIVWIQGGCSGRFLVQIENSKPKTQKEGEFCGKIYGGCLDGLACVIEGGGKWGKCRKIMSKMALGEVSNEGGPFGLAGPKYLSIKGVKDCLGSKSMGTWTAVCVPPNRPANCLESSWRELNGLTGTFQVAPCQEPQQEGQSCGGHMGPNGKCAPGLKCLCEWEMHGKLSARVGCGKCVKPGIEMTTEDEVGYAINED